jgi:hypothetical protein
VIEFVFFYVFVFVLFFVFVFVLFSLFLFMSVFLVPLSLFTKNATDMPLYKKRHGHLETQAIVEENSVRPIHSDNPHLEANKEHMVVASVTDSAGIDLQETVLHALEPLSWWKQPSPRLQTTDTLEHVSEG